MLQVSDTDPDQRNLNHHDDYFLLTNPTFTFLESKLKFKLRLRKFLAEHSNPSRKTFRSSSS